MNDPQPEGHMASHIERRKFLATLGGAAAAWPLAARAQQSAKLPVIGVLGFAWPEASVAAAFHKGLNETGYSEGRNVAIEFRWAQNDTARLLDLAADLVRWQVSSLLHWAAHRHLQRRPRPRQSDRFQHRRRSRANGSRRQPQSAGRQRYRHRRPAHAACRKTTRI